MTWYIDEGLKERRKFLDERKRKKGSGKDARAWRVCGIVLSVV
jgi:hypothetical protein